MVEYEIGLKIDSGALQRYCREGEIIMKLSCKIFGHKWMIKERSNVIQFDNMGYPLRLFIIECSKCKQSRQEWIDTTKCSTDVICKWYKDIPLPIPPKAEEKLK